MYGDDDRVDALKHANVQLSQLAQTSVASLIRNEFLVDGGGEWRVEAPPLRLSAGICPDERFSEQVSASSCTGVLLDRNLVLTAGHCIRDRSRCDAGFKVVFGYLQRDEQAIRLNADQVFACKRVVAHRNDPYASDPSLDYAVLELERDARPPLAPVRLGRSPEADGEQLLIIGASQGLPLKVHGAARTAGVPKSSSGYVSLVSDLFQGDSGAPVLSEQYEVVATVAGGQSDYTYDALAQCWRNRRVAAADVGAGERATLASAAVLDLCRSGYASDLCAGIVECGDGYCSEEEDASSCAADCARARLSPERNACSIATPGRAPARARLTLLMAAVAVVGLSRAARRGHGISL